MNKNYADFVSTSPQPIRFVGGPYHGRTHAVSGSFSELAVLNNRPIGFWDDGTQKDATPLMIEKAGYYRVWLGRTTPTLRVEECVMLWERIRPGSDESIQRWQELRAV